MINLSQRFINLFSRKMPVIESVDTLEEAVIECGVLPFFKSKVSRLSIQELAAPGMLFGNLKDDMGCWDWKGPVIQRRSSAYGKFFNRKAGFVSTDIFPYFLDYRRKKYPLKPGTLDEMIYEIILGHGAINSTTLRKIILGGKTKREAGDLVTLSDDAPKLSRHSLEAPLQRLQMAGRILIADFEYKLTRSGDRYGWGVALYTTPEQWFERDFETSELTTQKSFDMLIRKVSDHLPGFKKRDLRLLLK